MQIRKRVIPLALAALVGAVALALVVALGGSPASESGTASAAVVHHRHHAPKRLHRAESGETSEGTNAADTDNVQSGDQTSPDNNTGDNSQESDGTDSHQDAAGENVDHQCPPNCDTANGEQP